MAKQKGPGRPFKKGQTGNPNGSSRMAKLKTKLIGLPLEEVVLSGRVLMEDTDPDACGRIMAAPDSTLAMRLLATMADEALTKRNVPAFNAIFDRVYGKPKETVALGGDDKSGPVHLSVLTVEEKLERLERIRAMRQAAKSRK